MLDKEWMRLECEERRGGAVCFFQSILLDFLKSV